MKMQYSAARASIRTFALIFSLAAVTSLARSHARAYCLEAWSWPTTTVRVRIHADMQNELRHADGSAWTRTEVEEAVQWTLTRINESSRGDAPWLYLDTVTPASTCVWEDTDCCAEPHEDLVSTCGFDNTIHIVPTNCGGAYWLPSGTRHIIQVQSTDSAVPVVEEEGHPPVCNPSPAYYGHQWGGSEWAFENIILHEFGHSFGLWHSNDCVGSNWSTVCPTGASGCTVMTGENSVAAEVFTLDDANGLEAIYGARDAPVTRLFERTLPTTGWTSLSTTAPSAGSYFVASSNPLLSADHTVVTYAGYHRTADIPVAFSWDWPSLVTTSLLSPNLGSTTGPIGAAQSGTQRFVSSMQERMTSDARRWRRRLLVSSRNLVAPSSWSSASTDPSVGSLADTTVGGVSSARDPVSGFLIHAFRADDGRVLLQSGSGAGAFSNVIDTGVISMNTPRLACAGSGTTYNCILTVVDPGLPISTAHSQRLRFTDFSWSQTGLTATWAHGLYYTTGWWMHGEYSLAVARTSSGTYEYSVVYTRPVWSGSVPGSRAYVLRRAPPSTLFLDGGSLFDEWNADPHVALGGVGTSFEAFAFSRFRTP